MRGLGFFCFCFCFFIYKIKSIGDVSFISTVCGPVPNGPTEGARKGLTMQVLDAADLRGCTPAENNRYISKGRDLNRVSSRRYLAANKELKKKKEREGNSECQSSLPLFFSP